ncbi:P-loop containing nucleoside triphosphatehydrolases superfamily protein [Striga asiatica]|uniref:P-loop containing nucleoside triphosphatehydrolases superfamily protein n=1 Tax=Striga asiatica TaxID=4170 RepID=A0A5A7PQ81_STRAF|nr:P-loop containing nucleoside triphosphatehydrolases superfamily protein [Striga asiatica]
MGEASLGNARAVVSFIYGLAEKSRGVLGKLLGSRVMRGNSGRRQTGDPCVGDLGDGQQALRGHVGLPRGVMDDTRDVHFPATGAAHAAVIRRAAIRGRFNWFLILDDDSLVAETFRIKSIWCDEQRPGLVGIEISSLRKVRLTQTIESALGLTGIEGALFTLYLNGESRAMAKGLIWVSAEDMARNRSKILRTLNSPNVPLNLAARLAKKAEARAIFMLASEESVWLSGDLFVGEGQKETETDR